MGDRCREAVRLFDDGLSCTEAIVTAFCPGGREERETAVRASRGFGGGMGNGGVCGAVTGGIIVLGLASADSGPALMQKVGCLREEFTTRVGALECRSLLGFVPGSPAASAPRAFRDCRRFVCIVAEFLEKTLKR